MNDHGGVQLQHGGMAGEEDFKAQALSDGIDGVPQVFQRRGGVRVGPEQAGQLAPGRLLAENQVVQQGVRLPIGEGNALSIDLDRGTAQHFHI